MWSLFGFRPLKSGVGVLDAYSLMDWSSTEGTREQYMKQPPIFKAIIYLLLKGPVTQQRVVVHFIVESENSDTNRPLCVMFRQTVFPGEGNERIELSSLAGAVVWCLWARASELVSLGVRASSVPSCRPWAVYSKARVTCKMGTIMTGFSQSCCED